MASGTESSHRGFPGTVEVLSARGPPGRLAAVWTGSRGRRRPGRRPAGRRACAPPGPVERPARGRGRRRRFRAGWRPPPRRRRRAPPAAAASTVTAPASGSGRRRVATSASMPAGGPSDPSEGPLRPRRAFRVLPDRGCRAVRPPQTPVQRLCGSDSTPGYRCRRVPALAASPPRRSPSPVRLLRSPGRASPPGSPTCLLSVFPAALKPFPAGVG